MSRRFKELPPDVAEQLGKKVGDAKMASEVLAALHEVGYTLKPATEVILTVADEAIRQGWAELVVDGKDAELHYREFKADTDGKEWEVRVKLIKAGIDGQIHRLNMLSDDLSPDELGVLSLNFALAGDGEVDVDTFTITNERAEGKGFGAGLGLLTNVVIQNVMKKKIFPDAKTFNAIIDDRAAAQNDQKDRTGWSSTGAKLLGYEMISDPDDSIPEFERIFRV